MKTSSIQILDGSNQLSNQQEMHLVGPFLETFCKTLLKFLLRKDRASHYNNLCFEGPILSAIKPSWSGLLVQLWITPRFPLSKLRKLIILYNVTDILIWFISGGFCLLYMHFFFLLLANLFYLDSS